MIVKALTALSYKISMTEFRTNLSDNLLSNDKTTIIGCFDSEFKPLGFAMYCIFENVCSILIVETKDNQMAISTLLEEIRKICIANQVEKIYWKTEYSPIPDGFIEERCDYLYRVCRDQKPSYDNFKAQAEHLITRFKDSNFVTIPLLSCSIDQTNQIEKMYRTEHESNYMRHLLDNEDNKLKGNLSFVTLNNNEVVSFCILSENEENGCMLRYIYVRPDFRNTSAMLYPLINSIDSFITSPYKSLRWTINSNNHYSLNLISRRFPDIKPKLSVHTYLTNLKTN